MTDDTSFDLPDDDMTVKIRADGDYVLTVAAPFQSVAARGNVRMEVQVNGASQSGGVQSSSYIRAESSHYNASGALLFYLENLKVDDTVSVKASPGVRGSAEPEDSLAIPSGEAARIFMWRRN